MADTDKKKKQQEAVLKFLASRGTVPDPGGTPQAFDPLANVLAPANLQLAERGSMRGAEVTQYDREAAARLRAAMDAGDISLSGVSESPTGRWFQNQIARHTTDPNNRHVGVGMLFRNDVQKDRHQLEKKFGTDGLEALLAERQAELAPAGAPATDGRGALSLFNQNGLNATTPGQIPTGLPADLYIQSLQATGFAGQGMAQPGFKGLGIFNPLASDPSIREGQALEAIAANTQNSVFGAQRNQGFFNDLEAQRQADHLNTFKSKQAATKVDNANAQTTFSNALGIDQNRVQFEQKVAAAAFKAQQAEVDALSAKLAEQRAAVLDQVRLSNNRDFFAPGHVGDMAYAMAQGDTTVGVPAAAISYAAFEGGQGRVFGLGIAESFGVPVNKVGVKKARGGFNPFNSFDTTPGAEEPIRILGKTYDEDPIGWLLQHPEIGGRWLAGDADFYEPHPKAKKQDDFYDRISPGAIKPEKKLEAFNKLIKRLVVRDQGLREPDRIFQDDFVNQLIGNIQGETGLTPDTLTHTQFLSQQAQQNSLNQIFGAPSDG